MKTRKYMGKEYDSLPFRLVNILYRLIKNEKPTIEELAKEFNVGIRTIQIDIYQRLLPFEIKKDESGRLFLIL